MKRTPYKPKDKMYQPLLTHMREVAFAPVVLSESKRSDYETLTAAQEKRNRKNAKRLNHG